MKFTDIEFAVYVLPTIMLFLAMFLGSPVGEPVRTFELEGCDPFPIRKTRLDYVMDFELTLDFERLSDLAWYAEHPPCDDNITAEARAEFRECSVKYSQYFLKRYCEEGLCNNENKQRFLTRHCDSDPNCFETTFHHQDDEMWATRKWFRMDKCHSLVTIDNATDLVLRGGNAKYPMRIDEWAKTHCTTCAEFKICFSTFRCLWAGECSNTHKGGQFQYNNETMKINLDWLEHCSCGDGTVSIDYHTVQKLKEGETAPTTSHFF
ncbi:MAG: hypothetical protein ACTSUE_26360 [Promethearchaeota archaeon]